MLRVGYKVNLTVMNTKVKIIKMSLRRLMRARVKARCSTFSCFCFTFRLSSFKVPSTHPLCRATLTSIKGKVVSSSGTFMNPYSRNNVLSPQRHEDTN